MGIKIVTLALHAVSGRPIYVKSLDLHAFVRFVDRGKNSYYALQFIGKTENVLYPVRYDPANQGYVVIHDEVIDEVVDVD